MVEKTEQYVVDYATSLKYSYIPAEVVAAIKSVIMDLVGAIFAGSASKSIEETADLIRECGGNPE